MEDQGTIFQEILLGNGITEFRVKKGQEVAIVTEAIINGQTTKYTVNPETAD